MSDGILYHYGIRIFVCSKKSLKNDMWDLRMVELSIKILACSICLCVHSHCRRAGGDVRDKSEAVHDELCIGMCVVPACIDKLSLTILR